MPTDGKIPRSSAPAPQCIPCPQMVRTCAQVHPLLNASMPTDGKNPRSSADKHSREVGCGSRTEVWISLLGQKKAFRLDETLADAISGRACTVLRTLQRKQVSFRLSKPSVLCGLLSPTQDFFVAADRSGPHGHLLFFISAEPVSPFSFFFLFRWALCSSRFSFLATLAGATVKRRWRSS